VLFLPPFGSFQLRRPGQLGSGLEPRQAPLVVDRKRQDPGELALDRRDLFLDDGNAGQAVQDLADAAHCRALPALITSTSAMAS